MKNIARLAIMGLLAIMFMGCYKQTPPEQMGTPVQFKVVVMDDPAPSQDEADVIVATHIKKASYLLSPRTADTPYTFTLSIDGREIKEDVKGVEEVSSDLDREHGKGIHYTLEKRFRLQPGRHEISLKTEDRRSAKVEVKIKGGIVHSVKFEPLYGSRRSKTFWEGVIGYKVFLDDNEIK